MQTRALFAAFTTTLTLASQLGCGAIWDAINKKEEPTAEDRAAKREQRLAAIDNAHEAFLATPCEGLVDAFDKRYSRDYDSIPIGARGRDATFRETGRRFAECNLWSDLFRNAGRLMPDWFNEHRLREEDADLASVFTLLDPEIKMLEQLDAFLKAAPNPVFEYTAFRAPAVIVGWLKAQHPKEACALMARHYKKLGRGQLAAGWLFFELDGCGKQAMPIANANLKSDSADLRIQACTLIGKYGTAKDASRVRLLARNDPYVVPATYENGQYFPARYPVRQSCASAENKLSL